ncbi:rhodanese-related sulfurtransferase [Nitratireductor luteus]|uniref:oxygen-dependent tRNA uridine(34) hydroxylase TrhO n=1 Tax=Nitratireductor luteus TaxID=2976980 RepID=UPI00223FCA3A|nr:rhodanese-related sulfurtransferase [Nitratireductor luteus]
MQQTEANEPITVLALYRFARFDDFEAQREPLIALCRRFGIRGTLLLAHEGINGTVAGSADAIVELVAHLTAIPGLGVPDFKYSHASHMPFHRMKVRLKKEIVTMGVEGVDPAAQAGTYVDPREWNALVSQPDTVVIDTRNAYETAIGSFRDAIDPSTQSFTEFPRWVDENLERLKDRKVAMFCTGGIRCEKATAYLRMRGLDDVFHLKGGILKYLEEVPSHDSLWEGECFVFDERVSVGHGLVEGSATLCRACRHPLTPEERQSEHFREGISCPHCHDGKSKAERARYAERQRQVELARQRGRAFPIGQG